MEHSETLTNIAPALAAVYAAVRPVKKEAWNPYFKEHYADLAAIVEECQPLLAEHGLASIQWVGQTKLLGKTVETDPKAGTVVEKPVATVELTTMLLHTSGEWIAETASYPFVVAGFLSAGAAISAGRRWSIQAALQVVAEEAGEGAARKPAPDVAARDLCPAHKLQWVRRIGTQKDGEKKGQPFDFWACPAPKDAQGNYCKQRPPEGYDGPQQTETPQKRLVTASRRLFTRGEETNTAGWRGWLAARFGIDSQATLDTFSEAACEAALKEIGQHKPGSLFGWQPDPAADKEGEGPWEL